MKSIETLVRDPLEDAFFAAVDPELVASGWRSSVEVPYEIAPVEGRYFRPSEGLVMPVVHLSYHGRETRHRYIEVTVGVTCPAAERLLWVLKAPCNVTVDAAPGVESGPWELPLNREPDLRAAVTEATRLVQSHWQPIADRLADVDALTAGLIALGDEDETDGLQIPAILVAAGRTDEARTTLDDFRGRYRDADYDAWATEFETRLNAAVDIPPPSADAFPKPRLLTARELQLSWKEAGAAAAVVIGALARDLRRKRKPDPPT
jgi:hypothetical protein